MKPNPIKGTDDAHSMKKIKYCVNVQNNTLK